MAEFHFLRPAWLLLLLLLPLIAVLMRQRRLRAGDWRGVVDPALLPFLLVGDPAATRSRWPFAFLLTGLALASIALAGPAWQRLPQPVFRDQGALVVALDLSRSMDAADVAPSRLERARHKLIDILNARPEGQTGLVVFAQQPFVVSPLTTDAQTIVSLVQSLTTEIMPAGGSRPDRALELAGELIKQAGANRGEVLLIGDGSGRGAAADVATGLWAEGISVSVLGIGTEQGAPIPLGNGELLKDSGGNIVVPALEETGLRDIASRGGGRYMRMSIDDSDLRFLLAEQIAASQPGLDSGLETDLWREEGPWLALLLLPFAACAFRRGWVAVILCAVLVPLPRPAFAVEWDALLHTPDQRAMQALQEERFEEAVELFEDSQWRAAAAYRAGRFEESAAMLAPFEDPRAQYNRANALARAGDIPGAIEAYRSVLKADPEHEDAAFNLALLLEQQKQQQQQQEGEEGEEGEQQEQGDSEQQPGENGEQDDKGDESQNGQSGENENGEQQDDRQSGQDESGSDPDDSDGEQQAQEQSDQSDQDGQEDGDQEQQSGQEQDETEGEEGEARQAALAESAEESNQAVEQWLRRIPDDPGGLLRRKFRYQYRRAQPPTDDADGEPW